MKKLTRKELSEVMREMGRKGGRSRAKALSPGRRKDIAQKAANVRWRYLYE